jgi:putative ABC transport system permease protein
VLNDIRVALRSLGRAPGFTAVVVLTLALAIGANSAIFTVIDAVLLRPLPYDAPERLVMIWERNVDDPEGHEQVHPANYLDWKHRVRGIAEMGVLQDADLTVTGLGEPMQVPAQGVTASTFRVLGVEPALGRLFTDVEDTPSGPDVLVVSHEFWRTHLGGTPSALGRSFSVNGNLFTVIGVMPPGFRPPQTRAEMWWPLSLDPAVDYRATSGRFLRGIGRLAAGVSVAQAEAELRVVARELELAHRDNTGWSAVLVPLAEQVVGGTRQTLLVLGGVIAFVLLIACANIANLQLARASARQREVAVRAALGASRRRLLRGQFTESLVLAAIGGVCGLILAIWATEALVRAAPDTLPRASEIALSARTLAVTTGLVALSAILFGLLPALRATGADLQGMLKDGVRGSSAMRGRGALVAAQIALSLVLLVGAGLMLRSFVRLARIDPGFDVENVLTATVSLPGGRYEDEAARVAFFRRLLDRIRAIPGVTEASATSWIPFDFAGTIGHTVTVAGRPLPAPGEEIGSHIQAVDPAYFRAMGIELLRGETFSDADGADAGKIVINEELARTVFPDEEAIGRRLLMEWGDTLEAEIVGIVRNVHQRALDSAAARMVYWTHAQFARPRMSLVIRARDEPMRLVPAVAAELHALDPELPLAEPRPLDEYLGDSVAARRFTMLLLGSFAALALVLAAVGIAGVVSNGVARRTREIGVRMALGARPRDVLGMVMRQGMLMAGAGMLAGLAGALALSRVMRSLLYGTSPTDPVTFALVTLALGLVALVATFVPALRATRVDPNVALRED